MNNGTFYSGYGFVLDDLDESKLTKEESSVLSMIEVSDTLEDICGEFKDSEVVMYDVELAQDFFIYIPDVPRVYKTKPNIKLFTNDEANQILVDETKKIFKIVAEEELDDFQDNLNDLYNKSFTKDEIFKIIDHLVDKLNISQVNQWQWYIDDEF